MSLILQLNRGYRIDRATRDHLRALNKEAHRFNVAQLYREELRILAEYGSNQSSARRRRFLQGQETR